MEPGKFVFYYQYESRIPGRVFGSRGYKITSQIYKGDTIFCDAAFIKIIVHSQVPFTAEHTIISKLEFEREAMCAGVSV